MTDSISLAVDDGISVEAGRCVETPILAFEFDVVARGQKPGSAAWRSSTFGRLATMPPVDARRPSSASNLVLASRPPANPVRLPDAPMTRWHGAMIEMGFLPLAAPTARTALGLPTCMTSGFAERDGQQCGPDFFLKIGAVEIEGDVELLSGAGEIFI